MYRNHPHLAKIDAFAPGRYCEIEALASDTGGGGSRRSNRRSRAIILTNPIARASHVMQEQAALDEANAQAGGTGTDG